VQQPSGTKADRLRATAERIDALVTDAKSALDRLMTPPAPDRDRARPKPRAVETGSTTAVVDMLMENPVQSSATNEFEDMLYAVGADEPALAAAPTAASEPAALDAEPLPAASHDAHAAPTDDGRGVFALAMVTLSILVLAAFFGQHRAGVGIVGGANLLAWLVVVQQRRDARSSAQLAH
jgi:hypothetical protein